MSRKHFIDDPDQLVASALQAVTLTNPGVALDAAHKIVYRSPGPSTGSAQVSLLSGGGSGHEPSFSAMVGPGMLSAAVAGSIFASPSAEQVRVALTERVPGGEGVVVVVMNYTGDVLNFGLAVEKARTSGLRVEMVVVGDDVGVGRAKAGKVGRRGLAGTVLVLKMAGALAAAGRPLDDVARLARVAADNLVSVGASLDRVHVPGRAADDDDGDDDDGHGQRLGAGEVEIGMGIHNEPGSGRDRLKLRQLVGRMLAQLLDPADEDRAFLKLDSDQVVLLVNNLGGVSSLEMGAITSEIVAQLADGHGIRPVRVLSGTFMTSLNGMGFSITLLNVVDAGIGGPSMVELLDAPSEVVGWSAPIQAATWAAGGSEKTTATGLAGCRRRRVESKGLRMDSETAAAALRRALGSVIAAEPDITRYDSAVGDGDCGVGLKRGAEAILRQMKKQGLTGDAAVDVSSIAGVVEDSMDGTSGALYAIFLNALARALGDSAAGEATATVWAAALKDACSALSAYTPARPGDRTVIDALYPFVEVLGRTGDVAAAAEAATTGAEATKGMAARLGRAVYVGGSGFKEVPDAGAWGLACFLQGLAGKEAAAGQGRGGG